MFNIGCLLHVLHNCAFHVFDYCYVVIYRSVWGDLLNDFPPNLGNEGKIREGSFRNNSVNDLNDSEKAQRVKLCKGHPGNLSLFVEFMQL